MGATDDGIKALDRALEITKGFAADFERAALVAFWRGVFVGGATVLALWLAPIW